MTRHTHHLLPLLLLLPTLCFSKHVNVTVDDTAAGFVYLPLEAWRSSSNACVGCLNPSTSTAMNGTFHGATHALPAPDADDIGATDPDASSSKKAASSTKAASSSAAPKATSKPDTDGDGKGGKDTDADGDGDGGGSSKGGSGKSRRMLHLERLDADDEGFVDPPVTAQFNFTGTAIYIYAILPLLPPPSSSPTTLTSTNLSFKLDALVLPSFLHIPSASSSPSSAQFQPNVSVLAHTGLAETPHTLTITIAPGSTFLFDYLVYTHSEEDAQAPIAGSGGSSSNGSGTESGAVVVPTPTAESQTSPSPSVNDSVKKHNIATFAGAVGGSVGVLSIFALCLAISIIRRRRRSLKRDRLAQPNFSFVDTRHDASGGYSARARRGLLSFGRSREPRANVEEDDDESLHTDASEDAPPAMSGPAPFVPRYFPGTHVPADPPSYDSPAHAVPLASQPFSYHSPSGGLRVGGRADPVLSGVAEAYLAEDQSDDGLGEEDAGGHGMRGAGTRALTYADIPPNTPPPIMDEGVIIPAVAPPPFPIAIATPAPEAFASISGVAPASSLSTSTSTPSNNPTVPPLAHVDASDRTTAIHPPLVLPPGISYPVIGTRARAQDEDDDSDEDAASDTELLRSSSSSHPSSSHSVPESSHPTNAASSSAGSNSHGSAARVGAGVLSSAVGMSMLPPYSESPSARTSISDVARPSNLDITGSSPPTALSGPIRTHLDRVITRVASANDVSVHSGPERPRSRASMRSLRARAREQDQSSEDAA